MKVTAIKQQVKNPSRYSIFIDDKYCFSLSDLSLIESRLIVGQEIEKKDLEQYRQAADEDKIYNSCINYIARRMRSKWEIESYMRRKKASPTLINKILNKLSEKGLIDDKKYTHSFISDRNLLKPTSIRKLIIELRSKKIPESIISEAIEGIKNNELENLKKVISIKRRQNKYKDDLKLMQYLSRQGFSYNDIKEVLKRE